MYDKKRDRRSINTVQAIQDATDITIAEAVKWLSVLVACCWFWTTSHPDNQLIPPETPLHWLGRTANSAGWDISWTANLEQWLIAHPSSYWVLLAVAVFAAGHNRRGSNQQLESVAIISLLLSMSAHGPIHALRWFLGATLALCLVAILTDLAAQRRTRNSEDRVHAFPALSFVEWLVGPVAMLLLAVLAPLVLFALAVRDYRAPDHNELYSPYHLGIDAESLPSVPLKDVPANVALVFLAEALLFAQEGERRGLAIWGLRDHQPR